MSENDIGYPIAEAIADAKSWVRGTTLYHGARGWRACTFVLLEEIDRLQQQIHTLGVCQACLARDESTAADTRRLDWLADPDNTLGSVTLPREIVERNIPSLRDAIDEAMTRAEGTT